MARTPADRIDVLGGRVRWLDRYRRLVSIVLAVAMWLVISRELATLFGSEWPNALAMIVSVVFAGAVWWLIEITFAWMMAVWETEYDGLSRERGLPRAELLRGGNAYRRK